MKIEEPENSFLKKGDDFTNLVKYGVNSTIKSTYLYKYFYRI